MEKYQTNSKSKNEQNITSGMHSVSRRTFLKTGIATLSTSVFAGCSFGGPSDVKFKPVLSARPDTPSITPELGLSQLGIGRTRDGLLYVPQSYSEDETMGMPLLVALHGAGGSSDNWEGYYARAEAQGFVLLALDSRSSTWDLLFEGFGPDVSFMDVALEHTFERCRIDPARIALAGFSDGASYALSLGVSNGDLFTHLIGYSPGFLSPSKPFVGMPQIFISHGTVDIILSVRGTRKNIVPRFRNDGYDVTYHEFNGGHEVPSSVSGMALDWFLG